MNVSDVIEVSLQFSAVVAAAALIGCSCSYCGSNCAHELVWGVHVHTHGNTCSDIPREASTGREGQEAIP